MGYYSEVNVPSLDGDWDREPYVIVSHDNGIDGGRVRLIAGSNMDHAGQADMTREQAGELGRALLTAAERADWATT